MNPEKDAVFYLDLKYAKMIYPYSVSRVIENLGVLDQYRNKMYTRSEINKIIYDLLERNVFIPNSMEIRINVMANNGYYQMLTIKNFGYEKQEKTEEAVVQFKY